MKILYLTANSHPFSGSSVQITQLANDLNLSGFRCNVLHRLEPSHGEERRWALRACNSGLISKFEFGEELTFPEAIDRFAPHLIHAHVQMLPHIAQYLNDGAIPVVANYGSSASLSTATLSCITTVFPKAFVSVSIGGAKLLKAQVSELTNAEVRVIRQSTRIDCSDEEDVRIDRITQARPFVLKLAAFRPYKGIPDFCRAIELLNERKRILLGIIAGTFDSKQVTALSNTLNLPIASGPFRTLSIGNTKFVGPSEFPGSWTRRARVAVSASTGYEGISGAMREAMLARTPVVATDVGFNAELIKNGWNGTLVPSGDHDAVAKGIENALTAPEDMTQRAFHYVRLGFSSSRRNREHLSLYKDLCGGNRIARTSIK